MNGTLVMIPGEDPTWNATYGMDESTHASSTDASDVRADYRGRTGSKYPTAMLHLLDQNPMTVVVYGYVLPFLFLLTVVTNSLVCLVLLSRELRRSATNALLVAMAVSDTMTGLFPLPCFVYFYTLGNYLEWVPFDWCFVYFCLTEYLPTVTHTASVWLTVALAVQRYVYVRQSLHSKQANEVCHTLKIVAGIYFFAFASHCNRFAELQFVRIDGVESLVEPQVRVSACQYDYIPFVRRHETVYFNVYYWYRVVFIHLVPCLSLVGLNAALICTMRKAQERRRQLQARSRVAEVKRLSESNSTTMMLVTVVGLLLVVELPLAILFVITILENTVSVKIIEEETTSLASLSINLVILLSYPLNFFIYCGMSRQFRETFKDLFTYGKSSLKFLRQQRGHMADTSMATAEIVARRTELDTCTYIPLTTTTRQNPAAC